MTFKKGNKPWNKGLKKENDKRVMKISIAHRGRISPWKGKKLSETHRRKISIGGKGRILSKTARRNISNAKKGNKNPNWYGDNVGYAGVHSWIKRNYNKPKLCQNCKKAPPFDLANISGEYKRDLDDWEWLCRKCHMIKDGRLKKFLKYKKE